MTLELAAPPASRSARSQGWRPRFPGEFPTLGWGVLQWTNAHLPSPTDEHAPFTYTEAQANRVLRIYELDPVTGRRVYGRRVHEEEAKGWGKSPFAASLAIAEFRGPVLFDGWDADGRPVGRPWGTGGSPQPWIQIAAVSEAQTRNTYASVYLFLTANQSRAADELLIDPGKTLLYIRDMPLALMERVTASAGSREGQPLTHAVLDEPQLWTPANRGDLLARTILRNLTKSDGWAHFTGNAPVKGIGSVAEQYSGPDEGVIHFATRPEVEPQEDWEPARKLWAIRQVYRGVPWIVPERALADVLDPLVPWSEKLRFTFNTRADRTIEDPWMDAVVWDACSAPELSPSPTAPTFVCIRVAHDHRSAAVVMAQRHADRTIVRSRLFTGDEMGETLLDLSTVERHIGDLRVRYPERVLTSMRSGMTGREHLRSVAGPEIAYHGSFFEGSAQKVKAAGAAVLDVPSSQERLVPAAETLMSLALSGALAHDGDPVLAAHVGNVVAEPVPKGWAVAAADIGAGEPLPIIAAQAAMLAVHRAMTAPSAVRRPATFRSF